MSSADLKDTPLSEPDCTDMNGGEFSINEVKSEGLHQFQIPSEFSSQALKQPGGESSVPFKPWLPFMDHLGSPGFENSQEMIQKIVECLFDGLSKSTKWGLSINSFEDLLCLLQTTWVAASGREEDKMFWPGTMKDTLHILQLAGYQDATEIYTCLESDHYFNMHDVKSNCQFCGKSAKFCIKWLYVGEYYIFCRVNRSSGKVPSFR